jgi:hypothetical protein
MTLVAARVLCDGELAESVLAPYFAAARDVFVEELEARFRARSVLRQTRLVIDPDAHDTPRHFAGTNRTGSIVIAAPEMAELPEKTILAIFAHELGHAADFAYPAAWSWPKSGAGEVVYVGSDPEARATAWRTFFGKADRSSSGRYDAERPAINWTRAWERRNADQIEWAADGIAFWVTGKRIGYSGPCLLQSLERGAPLRPRGLR